MATKKELAKYPISISLWIDDDLKERIRVSSFMLREKPSDFMREALRASCDRVFDAMNEVCEEKA